MSDMLYLSRCFDSACDSGLDCIFPNAKPPFAYASAQPNRQIPIPSHGAAHNNLLQSRP